MDLNFKLKNKEIKYVSNNLTNNLQINHYNNNDLNNRNNTNFEYNKKIKTHEIIKNFQNQHINNLNNQLNEIFIKDKLEEDRLKIIKKNLEIEKNIIHNINLFIKYNKQYIKLLIFTNQYTIRNAKLLDKLLNRINIKCLIINKFINNKYIELTKNENNLYYFIFSPQWQLARPGKEQINLPKNKYFLYQLEQLNQNESIPYQNLQIISNYILNSYYTFDYSVTNLNLYPLFLKNKIKLLTPFIDNININNKYNFKNKLIDILFIGTLNKRRNNILNILKNKGYKIKIVENIFNDKLEEFINNSKIILNIHYYNNAILELFRIHDILSFNCFIISELPGDGDLDLIREKYNNFINFIPIISDDLDNICYLLNTIDKILSLDNIELNEIEKENFINNNNILNKKSILICLYKNLFHKYYLNIENFDNNIDFKIYDLTKIVPNHFKMIYTAEEYSKKSLFFNKNLFAHLHCFDISKFYENYKNYITIIEKYFSIIITYSIGNKDLINGKFILLQIKNKGLDIGAKFCVNKYLNDNNIKYEYILFLNPKSNQEISKKYFEPLVYNLNKEFIENIYKYDGYFPDIVWEIVGESLKWVSNNIEFKNYENTNCPEINLLYREEILNYLDQNNNTNRFIEGNCYILSKKVIDKLFTDPLLYNILNTESSFDYNWVCKYYNIEGNIDYVYKQFIEKKLDPKNEDSLGGYLEDVFERIILNFCDNYKILLNISNKNITNITSISSKDDFRILCNINLPLIKNIIIPNIEKDKLYETFYIEFREFDHCEFLIRNIIIKLPNWSHSVVCGNLNYNFMRNICNRISENIKIIKLNIDNLNTAEYSSLLMNKEFWNNFNGEKLLLYQEDSYMFHNRIDDFLKYDYVGAPWPIHQDEHINQKEYGVGNGGFSLRSKSKMIEVIEKVDWEKNLKLGPMLIEYMKNTNNYIIPEDVYFSKSLLEKNIGSVAPRNIAINFSQETQKSPDPLGGHNFFLSDNNKLPYYKKLFLNNEDYFNSVSHRGGWKSIIQYGIHNNIILSNLNYPEKIILEDCCENNFLWNDNCKIINHKWIGITHFTHNVPTIWGMTHIDNLLKKNKFIESLKNCKGLVVLSNYMKNYLEQVKSLKNIRIYNLKHPIDKFYNKFNLKNFLSLKKFDLILLGQQLRNISDIIKVNSKLINNKFWLSGIKLENIRNDRLYKDLLHNKIISNYQEFIKIKNTLQIPYISNFKDYDVLLTTSIILIPLYNASANNSVLEIIQTNTPAFVTRLPATEEYLGKDYPMFYDKIIEVNFILNNRELFNKKYTETYNYLKNMDKSDLTYKKFYSDLLKIINDVY